MNRLGSFFPVVPPESQLVPLPPQNYFYSPYHTTKWSYGGGGTAIIPMVTWVYRMFIAPFCVLETSPTTTSSSLYRTLSNEFTRKRLHLIFNSIQHIILDCHRKQFDSLILVTDHRNYLFNCWVLLNDSIVEITRAIAKFLVEILKSKFNHVLPPPPKKRRCFQLFLCFESVYIILTFLYWS